MVDLTEVLKPFKGSIRQQHHFGDKFVATVSDEVTRIKVLDALATHNLNTFVTVEALPLMVDEIVMSTTDKVKIVYMGAVEISSMIATGFGKKPNHQFFPRFLQIFKTNAIFEPIVLSQDLTIIDGEQRLRALIELNSQGDPSLAISKLPAIILNTTPIQAKSLRLAINKSKEFQRWHWDAVDAFLEKHPEYLPQLEPLGIFGERVLPESYFGKTVTTYEIYDETLGKTQQNFYKQEHGLARWAALRRKLEAKTLAESKSAKKADSLTNTTALFTIPGETN